MISQAWCFRQASSRELHNELLFSPTGQTNHFRSTCAQLRACVQACVTKQLTSIYFTTHEGKTVPVSSLAVYVGALLFAGSDLSNLRPQMHQSQSKVLTVVTPRLVREQIHALRRAQHPCPIPCMSPYAVLVDPTVAHTVRYSVGVYLDCCWRFPLWY